MERAEIITLVAAVLGLVPPVVNYMRGKPKPWLTSVLQGIAAGAIAGVVTYFIVGRAPDSAVSDDRAAGAPAVQLASEPPRLSVRIQDPQDGQLIECTFNTERQCGRTVSGTASGLAAGQRIYTLIKEQGGGQWWVSGGAIEPLELVKGEWRQPRASFGHRDSPVKDYIVAAIVTTQHYESGQLLAVLPDGILGSDSVTVKRK